MLIHCNPSSSISCVAINAQTLLNTCAPSSSIRPTCSAMGMNSIGETMHPLSSRMRANASAPTSLRESLCTIGCRKTSTSLRSSTPSSVLSVATCSYTSPMLRVSLLESDAIDMSRSALSSESVRVLMILSAVLRPVNFAPLNVPPMLNA